MVGRVLAVLALVLGLQGCEVSPVEVPPVPSPASDAGPPSPAVAVSNARVVAERVEPVAEQVCRTRRPRGRCNFDIVVINDPRQSPNAFQTVDRQGRPVIALTIGLIATVRNQDELAFILGHEAAHHIAGHLERTQGDALAGAVIGGVLASVTGARADAIRDAQRLGATVGARRYSKTYELEADALGTRIAMEAGYDPLKGAAYFNRIADPGDAFLGTHPPNGARIATVRREVAEIRAGR